MVLFLVNFKRELDDDITEDLKNWDTERQERIETYKWSKIAELLDINNNEMKDYVLISLYPLNKIFANNLLKLHYPYIIYEINELKENARSFFVGDTHKLYYAETVLNGDDYIEKFIDSIHPIDTELIDDIAKTSLIMSIYEDIPSVNFENECELIAVLPINSGLLNKEYGRLTDEGYYEIRRSLVDEQLILKKVYKECRYCHKEGYGDSIDDERGRVWICPFCKKQEIF